MKNLLLLLLVLSTQESFAANSPWVWSGRTAKSLFDTATCSFNFVAGTANPTSTATNACKGSLYCRTGASGGACYVKQDNGSSTNWTIMASGGGDLVGPGTSVTANTVAYFNGTSGTSIGSSALFVDPSSGKIGLGVAPHPNGSLTIKATSSFGDTSMVFLDSSNNLDAQWGVAKTAGNFANDSGVGDLVFRAEGDGTNSVRFSTENADTRLAIHPSSIEFFQIADMNNKRITELATPTTSTDAATKAYVDDRLKSANASTQRFEYARGTCSGASAISAQSHGGWTIGNIGTGTCAITMSGFSAAPTCTISRTGKPSATEFAFGAAATSSTNLDISGVQLAGTDATTFDFSVMCMGTSS